MSTVNQYRVQQRVSNCISLIAWIYWVIRLRWVELKYYIKTIKLKFITSNHSLQQTKMKSKWLWYLKKKDPSLLHYYYSHCPGRRGWDGAEALLCERRTQTGWRWHSFLHKISKISLWCLCEGNVRIKAIKGGFRVWAPAAMAPTSGTRHVCTGLHQWPMISTTPSGSLTTIHSSSVVDCMDVTRAELGYDSDRALIGRCVTNRKASARFPLTERALQLILICFGSTIHFFVGARQNVLSGKLM